MYFLKKVYAESWGIFENFCVKSNLTVCKITFNCTCKLQIKIGGAGCTSCSPNNFVWENCFPCSPDFRACEFFEHVSTLLDCQRTREVEQVDTILWGPV